MPTSPCRLDMARPFRQPYIVAIMTQAIKPGSKQRVLEVGTGSGYQAAVLAELVAEVYTIELISELAEEAAGRLKKLGYNNVHAKAGDGYKGWPERAPFDAILVTCGAEHVPEPLVKQLKRVEPWSFPWETSGRASGSELSQKGQTASWNRAMSSRCVLFPCAAKVT